MSFLTPRLTLALAAAAFMVGVPAPAAAQDLFGSAVTVANGQVLVLKPSATRGPAAVYRFTAGEGGVWQLQDELRSPTGADSGEGLNPSLAWTGEELLVGSGDPNGAVAAHVFGPDGNGAGGGGGTGAGSEGGWAHRSAVALGGEQAVAPSAGIDLATVMRILTPPGRTVAAHGERGAVAVTGSQVPDAVGVRAMVAGPNGWAVGAAVAPPPDVVDLEFGAAMVMSDTHLVVGSPGVGRVFVYGWDSEADAWAFQAELVHEPHSGVAGFGASLALDDDVVLVGAPGDGAAVVFQRAGDAWAAETVLEPSDGMGPSGFGSAVGLSGGEAWVGAPALDDRAGGVERFRGGMAGEWTRLEPLDLAGVGPGFGAGAALALDGQIGAVGAPMADGGSGRVAILTRTDDGGWSPPVWVDAGSQLQTLIADEAVTCEDGSAAGFSCSDVDLLAFLSLETLGAAPGESMSDVWGWTDPETRRDYALVGRTGGASIVDVTNPSSPLVIGTVSANPSNARDLKVYQDHLFFTGDGAGDHGLVVFDLTRLRDVSETPAPFEPDAVYDGISSAHNLVIDEEAGFAYPVGASGGGTTCGGGLHMVDIKDPVNPVFAGCFTDTEGLIWQGRTHDAQCTVYRGPDSRFQGQQVCFVSNETALRIVDVTDKENPAPLGVASYPGAAYIHQGWLTDDQRYFFLNDELDELVGSSDRTRTLIWDVSDLEDPVLVGDVFGPDAATDHNLFIKGNRMYQANYRAGLRVFDITDPEAPTEVGWFDTTPWEGNPPGFTAGAWTAWPYFESGTVVVSSIHEGLFLLRPVRRELIP